MGMKALLLILCLLQSLQSTAFAGVIGFYRYSRAGTGLCGGVMMGDSLSGGLGISSGANTLPAAMSNYSNGNLSIRNYSVGGSKWEEFLGQLANALTNKPQWAYVHLGINNANTCLFTNGFTLCADVCPGVNGQMYPCYWPTISSILHTGAMWCASSNVILFIGEILPAYTNLQAFGYPGIRALNTAISNWCNTNQFAAHTKMVIQHDAFAILNPTSGELDWFNPLYHLSPSDGLHANLLFHNYVWGPHLVSYMGQFFPDPPLTIGGKIITRVVP